MTDRDWTVLLIGGGAGSGKTALARALGKHFDVPVIEGDLFRIALTNPLYRGVDPDLNVYFEAGFWQRPLDQLIEGSRRLSRRMFKVCEFIVARQGRTSAPVIIQADWVLPELATKDSFDGVPMPGQVRSLYVYEPDLNILYQRLDDRPDTWWSAVPEEEKAPRVAMLHATGLEVKRHADALGLPVLECLPFESLFNRALAVLGPP